MKLEDYESIRVVAALGKIIYEPATELLIRTLTNKFADKNAKTRAMGLLSEWKKSECRPTVRQLVLDENNEVAFEAAGTCRRFSDP